MTPRIDAELALVQTRFQDLVHVRDSGWVLIPQYGEFEGWTPSPLPVAFQIQPSHPGVTPYGFYVPSGTRFCGAMPNNYTEPAGTKPPFDGAWGFFSWSPENWEPKADIHSGANLYIWVLGFANRFREGT